MPGKRDLTLLFGVRLLSAMGVTLILDVYKRQVQSITKPVSPVLRESIWLLLVEVEDDQL